jgi:hypothetical protein
VILEDNKCIVAHFFDAFSRGAIDEAFALMSDSATWWVPGTLPFSGTKSKAQYLQIVALSQKGFPSGVNFKVISLLAEDDRVAAEVESLGQHTNGKSYNNKYHFLFRLKDGRFVEVKE